MVHLQGTLEVPTPGGVVGQGGFEAKPLEGQEGCEHRGCCPVEGEEGGGHNSRSWRVVGEEGKLRVGRHLGSWGRQLFICINWEQ